MGANNKNRKAARTIFHNLIRHRALAHPARLKDGDDD
jgi:hypothetical protein